MYTKPHAPAAPNTFAELAGAANEPNPEAAGAWEAKDPWAPKAPLAGVAPKPDAADVAPKAGVPNAPAAGAMGCAANPPPNMPLMWVERVQRIVKQAWKQAWNIYIHIYKARIWKEGVEEAK